jgi:hypothetical protein
MSAVLSFVARYGVVTIVLIKVLVFLDITPCHLLFNGYFKAGEDNLFDFEDEGIAILPNCDYSPF